jgi:hypothetical protein
LRVYCVASVAAFASFIAVLHQTFLMDFKKEDWMLVERRGACAFYARKPSFPPLSFANPITSS